MGTTGESPTLTHEEHERVIALTCEHAAGRIRVMAGTGSNSTQEAIQLTKFAKSVGADGAMMVAPYYNKPTGEGFFRHFEAVATAVDIPIILYNIPGRTAKNMEPETIARMAESVDCGYQGSDRVDGSGFATPCRNKSHSSLWRRQPDFTLLSMGGSGIVSVVGKHRPAGHAQTGGCLEGWQNC